MMIIVCLKILDRAHFLPNIGSGAETRSQYQGLCQALDEYTRKTFYEWTQTVDKVEHFIIILYNHAMSVVVGIGIGVILHQHQCWHLCTPPPGTGLYIETSYLVYLCTCVPHICTSNI